MSSSINPNNLRFPQQCSSLLAAPATIFLLKIADTARSKNAGSGSSFDVGSLYTISFPFTILNQFCHSDGHFWWPLPSNSHETLSCINKSKPTQPKVLFFFSWHIAEWAVRFFFSEQLESTRIPLCQKLVGLVFANLTERIHTTTWALFVWWWFASNY